MDVPELELQHVRDRELELKRITGEISCAECRRLKLRCDRKIPCCSCIRRGYKNICPTGTSTGSNVRRIDVNAASNPNGDGVDAARRLAAMSERIRALEDALQIATDATHPLLSPELLSIKRTSDKADSVEMDGPVEAELENAFGTLTIGEGKTMQFLGASAGEDILLMDVFGSAPASHHRDFSELPAELAQLSEMWPFVPAHLPQRSKLCQLGSYLPPFERVKELVKAFFSRPAWFVDRSQIEGELVPLFYPEGSPIFPARLNTENMHDLALLFMVLADGVLTEKVEFLVHPEAERYQHLSRTALSLDSIFEHASLSTCQVLILLSSYEVHTGRKAGPECAWKLTSLGMVLAASIGLHRDPTHWRLDPVTVNRRRWAFWELYSLDKWKCLGSGRPPLFPAHVVDCKFPDDEGILDDNGTEVESIRQWKYRFSRDVLARLADLVCSARPRQYSDIMSLDRLVRDFEVHPLVTQSLDSDFPLNVERLSLHPLFSVWWKERALLYVHRNHFARAVLEHGDDPMKSPYAVSFLAAFRSSVTILKTAQLAFDRRSSMLKCHSQFWAMALSSAIVVGTVASRTSTNFSVLALCELERAILMFGKSSHPVASHGLTVLLKLRDKAISASNKLPSRIVSRSSSSIHGAANVTDSTERESSADDDEELHIMRGTTRRIDRRTATPAWTLQKVSQMTAMQLPYSSTPHNGITGDGKSKPMDVVASLPGILDSSDGASDIIRTSFPDILEHRPQISMDQNTSGRHSSPASSERHFFRPVDESPNQSLGYSQSVVFNDLTSSFLAHFEEHQQLAEESKDVSRRQAHHSEPDTASSWSDGLGFSTPLDRAFEDILAAGYSEGVSPVFNHSEESNATDYPFFDLSAFAHAPTASVQMSTSQTRSDFSDTYPDGNTASPESWRSFIQQFNLTDDTFQNWDAMEFS